MPDLFTFTRRLLFCAALLGAAALSLPASAQMYPPPPVPQGAPPPAAGVNPICPRLEAQLATIDRGGSNDPARDEQIRRYQDAAARQQGELDRLTAQARRMGCDSSGFLSLFSGQSAQCGPINNQIQQMRANLDQMTNSLEQLRSGGPGGERDSQRRSVLIALGQNNCGPQYAQFANGATGPGGFLSNLFGNNSNPNVPPPGADMGQPSGTYRTVCVRSCDGHYFPVTAHAGMSAADACRSFCPTAETKLYTGSDIDSATFVCSSAKAKGRPPDDRDCRIGRRRTTRSRDVDVRACSEGYLCGHFRRQ